MYFNKDGILHRILCPYTHEQNGLSERKIRHIVDMGLTLFAHAHVPFSYWPHGFCTVVNCINSLSTNVLKNNSPFEKLYNSAPKYHDTRIFGYTIYPYLCPYHQHKFSFHSQQCIYL